MKNRMKCDSCQHKVVCKKRHLMKDFVHVDKICENWKEESEKDEKWHDLRKNRNDLPEIGKEIIIGSDFSWAGLIYTCETASERMIKYMFDNPKKVICWKYLNEFKG